MTRYTVEQVTEKKASGAIKTTWVVRCPDGSIANGYHHPTEAGAAKHAGICNAFCLPWIREQLEKLENEKSEQINHPGK